MSDIDLQQVINNLTARISNISLEHAVASAQLKAERQKILDLEEQLTNLTIENKRLTEGNNGLVQKEKK